MAVLKRGQWPKFYFTKNGKGGIRRKTYLSAVGDVPPTNLFEYKDVGHTDEAKKEVLKVFDGQSPFATPKPERLIKRVLEIATDEGDLVMDSFLGSGTTAAGRDAAWEPGGEPVRRGGRPHGHAPCPVSERVPSSARVLSDAQGQAPCRREGREQPSLSRKSSHTRVPRLPS